MRAQCSRPERILVASSGDRSGTSAVADEGHIEPFVVTKSQVDLDTVPTTSRASNANGARPLRTTTISHFQLETSRATRNAGTARSSCDTEAGDLMATSAPAKPVATLAGAEARAGAPRAAPAPPAATDSKNTRVSPKYRPFLVRPTLPLCSAHGAKAQTRRGHLMCDASPQSARGALVLPHAQWHRV